VKETLTRLNDNRKQNFNLSLVV